VLFLGKLRVFLSEPVTAEKGSGGASGPGASVVDSRTLLWPTQESMRALRALVRDYTLLPRLFWTLWMGVLVNRMGVVVVPFLGLYLTTQAGLSAEQAGMVVGAYGAGQIVASWLGGELADRIGRKRTIQLALFGGALWMLALSRVHGLLASLSCVFALACFAELYRPAFGALISDIVPEPLRYLAYAANHWAINLGFSIAMLAGGLVARASYTLLFYVDAATSLLYGLLVTLCAPETRPVHAAPASLASEGATSGGMFRDRRFMTFLVLTFCLALVFSQALFTLPLYLQSLGFGAQVFGSLMAINGVLIVVLQPIVVRLTRHTSPEHVFVFAVLAQGLGFGLHGASPAGLMQLVALLIWTLGEIATVPISVAVVAALSPSSARGRYQGAYAAVWSLAIMGGPLIGGLVLSRLGASTLWAGCVVLGILSALLALTTGALRTGTAAASSP
jgi:MFS family permease